MSENAKDALAARTGVSTSISAMSPTVATPSISCAPDSAGTTPLPAPGSMEIVPPSMMTATRGFDDAAADLA